MLRKPNYPVANCSIKMPDGMPHSESTVCEDDGEQVQKRQQLINFGNSQWGFNNWSWTVTKQELDFVDFNNGKYCAGVVAFVSITLKTFDIHRENIGYATSVAPNKGFAIYKSRKCAVTNALRETLLSFGGSVASELLEILETHKTEFSNPNMAGIVPEPMPENNQNIPNNQSMPHNQNVPNKPCCEVKNTPIVKNIKKEDSTPANSVRGSVKNASNLCRVSRGPAPPPAGPPAGPPVGHPAGPPSGHPAGPPAAPRPPSNVSFVLQPVVGPVVPPLYAPPRLAPPPPTHVYPNYYEYATGPWHFAYDYDRHHGNVNLNFNIPPKNLVVNGRPGSVECRNACRQVPSGAEGEPIQYGPPPQNQGCWIKPTIFYDGFWTEQKVKKWVTEQVEKQFPEDTSHKSSSPNNGPDSTGK